MTIQREPAGSSEPGPSASSQSWYSPISWNARGTVSAGQPERAATSARLRREERGSGTAPTSCPLRSLLVLRRSRPPWGWWWWWWKVWRERREREREREREKVFERRGRGREREEARGGRRFKTPLLSSPLRSSKGSRCPRAFRGPRRPARRAPGPRAPVFFFFFCREQEVFKRGI